MSDKIDKVSPKENIIVKGAQLHNLKNIDVVIPRNQLVVITGLSGSGKSSLAFDTLYAEGQRRYVESLSSYARQFLGRLNKPKVEYIKGIAPAIAIEQKVNSTNPRSTVGTSTEIYDYIKLLFSRIGKTYSPISNEEVKKDKVSDVVDYIKSFPAKTKLLLLTPIATKNRTIEEQLNILHQQGYSRIAVDEEIIRIDQFSNKKFKTIFLVVDRIVVKDDNGFFNRVADAIQLAFYEGNGTCTIKNVDGNNIKKFSNQFELDNIRFIEPNTHLFSFNNPFGACPVCEGYGDIIGIDPELVIPNTSLSVYQNAIAPWKGETLGWYRDQLINNAHKFNFPIHRPIFELADTEINLIWEGNNHFEGLNSFFKELESKSYKIQNRVLLSRYRGKTKCGSCKGKRLKEEANYVKINGVSISDLVDKPIVDLIPFFNSLKLNPYQEKVSKRLLKEIKSRLSFLSNVGLDYLSLNRKSNSLSGGESQRINLATSLGSSLVGSMYILDEPSIGLHSKDTERLIHVLKNLRDIGNTVIVVEHDEDIMRAADTIIDIGPAAGYLGGQVVASGSYKNILKSNSLTAKYLNSELQIPVPKMRRTSKYFVEIKGAKANNLKNIDVRFPLNMLTVVTGVSGSGKSSLVKNILYPLLSREINKTNDKPSQFSEFTGNYNHLKQIEFIDQNPIGRSSRSNPITYIKAYDDIRALYASEKLSKIRGYKPKHFSFNVDGGRCETCKGDGEVTIEMQFMADVHLTCDNCKGKRFKKEILEVNYNGKSIDDILNLTIDEAYSFFDENKQSRLVEKLKPLVEVGLGYVKLGQKSSTLSGGEAQRIKLATFLGKGGQNRPTLFIFDEPTTGLHFHDINKLLNSFNALIENGHSVIVIEHNLDLIKNADYVIDLGPDGGDKGGRLVAFGSPEELVSQKKSLTAEYLKVKL